ncbi:MAG TPA: hypothetical protein VEU32_12790 [Burkholderiales bacterium]|nr:hypothetical protein [Burkholderiales bacterium]
MAKLSKRAKARNARIEAAQLLGKWTSLAQGHVLMGGNCSCGLGAGSLRIDEFEQQILDYLDGKHALRERGSLGELLRSIAKDAESARWLPLLDDLKRTLESFEEAHKGR